MENVFKDILKGKAVIMGVGNILKADDGLGPMFIERLKGKVSATCIDAATAPENYTGKISKADPDTILIVDAADLGKNPGDFAILTKDEILRSGFTTHDLSPAMLMGYLQARTGADIYLLGIQPEKVDFGEGLSESVEKTLKELEGLILEASRTPGALPSEYLRILRPSGNT